MGKARRGFCSAAIYLVAIVLAIVGLAAFPLTRAYALEDMKVVTEDDLTSGKINGTNWMSGISGERYLHEITIPGTHDSAMKDIDNAKTNLGAVVDFFGGSSAQTQELYISDQLKAGARMFDLRLTDMPWDRVRGTPGGFVWLCHGPDLGGGMYISATFYALRPYGERSADDKHYRLEHLMSYYTKFLEEHPTETLIVQVTNESDAGDKQRVFLIAHDIIRKFGSKTNPKTGKPFVYRENYSGDDWKVNKMPKLEDVRGQILIASDSRDMLRIGMQLGTNNGWSDNSGIADVKFRFENHYESTDVEKADFIKAFYDGGTANGQTIAGYDRRYGKRLNSAGSKNERIDTLSLAYTSSNAITRGKVTEKPINVARWVNPWIITNSDALMNTRGRYFGWVGIDFFTEKIARTVWMNNYPVGGFGYTHVKYSPGTGSGKEKTLTVQAGTKITLPKNMYQSKDEKSLPFLGWMVGDKLMKPGETITAEEGDLNITAQFGVTWKLLQSQINAASSGEVIALTGDVKGVASDTALKVEKGKTVVLRLNGHELNRAGHGGEAGSAFIVEGNLTIAGPGTISGGNAPRGGGILVKNGGRVELQGVTVSENTVMGGDGGGICVESGGAAVLQGATVTRNSGGGIYIKSGGTVELQDSSVVDNRSTYPGEGIHVQKDGVLKVSGSTKVDGNEAEARKRNVRLEEGAVITGISTLSLDGKIGVITAKAPKPGEPVVITDALSGEGDLDHLVYDLKESGQVGIALNGDKKAILTGPYKVTFDSKGGEYVGYQEVLPRDRVGRPTDPKRNGAYFEGWYKPGATEPYNFSTPVTEDMTLEAHWRLNEYSVEFDSAGGTPVATQIVAYGEKAKRPADPTREGYEFDCWKQYIFVGDGKYEYKLVYTFENTVGENTKLQAAWKPKACVVKFDSDGGSAVDAQSLNYGGKVAEPTSPTREGFTFIGWFEGDSQSKYNFSAEVRKDITLKAKWEKNLPASYTVAFDGNGEGVAGVPDKQTVKRGEAATRPEKSPTREGYVFAGWFAGDSTYDFSSIVTGDVTLKAQWARPKMWTVTYDTNGGTSIAAVQVKDGNKAVKPTDPTREGFDFGGWFTDAKCSDGNEYGFDSAVNGDLALFAKWVAKTHTVAFDSAGGSAVASQKVAYGDKVARPSDPVRSGYVFAGWLKDGSSYSFDAAVTADFTLVAQWVEPAMWIVSFDSAGGTAVEAQHIKDGSKATRPADPTRSGYTFGGWFANSECAGDAYNFEAAVADNLVLYAKWAPLAYDITFDGNGEGAAGVPEKQVVTHGGMVTRPADPTREGYTFVGWYAGEAPYDFSAVVTGNLALKAQWKAVPKTWVVAFDAANGTAVEAQHVKDGDKAKKPADPMREGFDFEGWFDDKACEGAEHDFSAAVTGNVIVYAKWSPKIYTVAFDGGGEGATGVPKAQSVKHGDKVSRPADPAREGYLFAGWLVGGTSYDFDSVVTGNLTLTAQWAEPMEWIVVFDGNGSSEVAAQYVVDGDKVMQPADPSRTGYDFGGWFTDAECSDGSQYNFNSPVKNDIILYAKWTPKTYVVVFDGNGEDVTGVPGSLTVVHGGKVARPTDPQRAGYVFSGWRSKSGLPYDFDAPVTNGLELVAQWTKVEPKVWAVVFDSAGGSAVETESVQDGGVATRPNDPVRTGYDFNGWFDNAECAGNAYDFTSTVKGHMRLYAKWIAKTYGVTFDGNGEGVTGVPGSLTVVHGDKVVRPADPRRSGYVFAGWYAGEVPYDFDTVVTSSLALTAHWVEPRTWMAAFDSNGGSAVEVQRVKDGDKVARPADPRREGYEFDGWFANSERTVSYDFDTPVKSNITVYAKWTAKTYSISFDGNGEGVAGVPETQTVAYGDTATRPADPTREGYVFAGWFKGDLPYSFDAVVTGDLSLKAQWTKIPDTWIVTFDSADGTSIDPEFVLDGEKATRPADPTRAGYAFDGWYADVNRTGAPFDFKTAVKGNLVLYAKWVPNAYAVTFDGNGEDVAGVPAKQTVSHGGKVTRPADPVRSGYVFAGWFAGASPYDFDDAVTRDLTLTAQWTEPAMWIVAFDSAGGTVVEAERVKDGDKVGKPADPTREGYSFSGWFTDPKHAGSSEYNFDSPVKDNLTLFAKWTANKHSVAFDSAGGTVVASQSVSYGDKATRPADPTRDGYVFAGWFAGGSPYDFNAVVTGDVALKAQWMKVSETWVVIFDSAGGTPVDAQLVVDGEKASRPENPTRASYEFDGWYTDAEEPYDFEAAVKGELVLYAKWTPVMHQVTFDSAGGSVIDAQTVAQGAKVAKPKDPTKDHCTFLGWRVGAADNLYDFDAPVTESMVLTAQWSLDSCTVTFDCDGGTAVESQLVPFGGYVKEPVKPTRENYAFAGWYEDVPFDEEVTAEIVEAIKDDPALSRWIWILDDGQGGYSLRGEHDFEGDQIFGDTTLHARWTVNAHTVSFDTNGGDTVVPDQVVNHGSMASEPEQDPERAGYYFIGWYTDQRCSEEDWFDFDTAVIEDKKLYAGWQPEPFGVTIELGNGEDPIYQVIEYNEKAQQPEAPTRVGYVFKGWSTKEDFSDDFDFETPITTDTVVYAKWEPNSCTAKFDANGGAPVPGDQRVSYGETFTEPADKPSKANCSFVGWYLQVMDEPLDDTTANEIREDLGFSRDYWVTDDNYLFALYEFEFPAEGDIVLRARWVPDTCTVKFDVDGGTPQPSEAVIKTGTMPSKPAVDPVKEGFTFAGWWATEEENVDDEILDYIRHDSDLSQQYWATDGNDLRVPFDFGSDTVFTDMTLYARWIPAGDPASFTVTFVDESGDVVDEQTVSAGDTPLEVYGDDSEGYVFVGWFADESHSQAYDFSKPIESDTMVYGKWTPLVCAVAFNSNGGSVVTPMVQKVDYGKLATKPVNPTRKGYRFLGWYEDVSNEITPDELARTKAEVLEILNDEALDPEDAVGLRQYYQVLTDHLTVFNGKVMMDYDPATDSVYYDMTVQAQWAQESPGEATGKTYEVDGNVYKVTSDVKNTAMLVKAKNAKTVVVPAKVAINGKSYKVTAIGSKAFSSAKGTLKSAVVGKNVTVIGKKAFAGCSKLKKVVVKTKKLTKKKVKGSLKKSSVKVVKVKVGKAKANKACVKKYAKFFTKANCGKKVAVK